MRALTHRLADLAVAGRLPGVPSMRELVHVYKVRSVRPPTWRLPAMMVLKTMLVLRLERFAPIGANRFLVAVARPADRRPQPIRNLHAPRHPISNG
jgi:hypothetical protein